MQKIEHRTNTAREDSQKMLGMSIGNVDKPKKEGNS